MSVSGICPVGMSLGVFPKGVYPMEYVGSLGYVQGCLIMGMSRGMSIGVCPKGV